MVLWVVKVERFQRHERPSFLHATSKVDQCCVQLVSSRSSRFFFSPFCWLFPGFLHCDGLSVTSHLACVYHVFMITMIYWESMRKKWEKANESKLCKGNWMENGRKLKEYWKETERRMEGNWKDNGRKLKGEWKEIERRMAGNWKDNGRKLKR